MTFNFPANVERDIQQYAQVEHLSPAEAATKLIQEALKAKKRKAAKGELTEAEWQKIQEADPGFAFFEKLPESVVESIAQASRNTRAERFKPRA